MPNLYKQWSVQPGQSDARVITSNEAAERKLQELTKKLRMQAVTEGSPDGFAEGLFAEEVVVASPEELREEAQKEAADIVAEAQEQAKQTVAAAQEEAVHVKEAAQREGYEAGLQEGRTQASQELEQSRQQLLNQKQQLEQQYVQKRDELEPELLEVMIRVFEKVFHVQFDDKKEILVYLIENALLNMEGSTDFQVRVCEQNYAFVQGHKDEIMGRIGQNCTIHIVADAVLQDNQCMIETDAGIFDCSLGVQLENLIKDLRSLCS